MLCNENQCFGCFACYNRCPTHAIKMEENGDGAIIPRIHKEKCSNCRACEGVCPVLHKPSSHPVKKCYAAWNMDKQVLKTAASGGIVSTIYQWAYDQGGDAFGTIYKDGELVFSDSDETNSFLAFSGSKYIHAHIRDTYRKTKEKLLSGRPVVFTATPCQISGLKSYLGKEYPNLFLVDLICHGVTPQKYLQEYIKDKTRFLYDRVFFRGENGNRIAAYQDDKLIYCKDKWDDPFSIAYAKGMICRENCYSCPFASLERQGDITAGDFWGLKRDHLAIDSSDIPFISLALVNTEKGSIMFDSISRNIYFEERSVDEALSGNGQLKVPCPRNAERELFLSRYRKKGFACALKATGLYKSTIRDSLIRRMKKRIRNIVKA